MYFCICNRKPGDGQDNLETSDAKSPRENEHIIVMGYGQLYKMPIKSNAKWLSFQEVFKLLLIIQSEAIQLKGREISEGNYDVFNFQISLKYGFCNKSFRKDETLTS